MRGQAGSRKRITLNYPREIVRIILLLCLLGSVAAFATSREKGALRVYARTTQADQAIKTVPISLPAMTSRPKNGQSATVPATRSPATASVPQTKEPAAVANLEPFVESSGFRMLWVTAGFGLVILLRCQRRNPPRPARR
jgi:hypothetical protein